MREIVAAAALPATVMIDFILHQHYVLAVVLSGAGRGRAWKRKSLGWD